MIVSWKLVNRLDFTEVHYTAIITCIHDPHLESDCYYMYVEKLVKRKRDRYPHHYKSSRKMMQMKHSFGLRSALYSPLVKDVHLTYMAP